MSKLEIRSIDRLKHLLDEAGVFYKFDDALRLWTIIAGDVTFYIDPKELMSLGEDEFELYISKQYLLGSVRMDSDEVSLH